MNLFCFDTNFCALYSHCQVFSDWRIVWFSGVSTSRCVLAHMSLTHDNRTRDSTKQMPQKYSTVLQNDSRSVQKETASKENQAYKNTSHVFHWRQFFAGQAKLGEIWSSSEVRIKCLRKIERQPYYLISSQTLTQGSPKLIPCHKWTWEIPRCNGSLF